MSYKLQFEIHNDSGNFTYSYDNNSHLCDEFDTILDAHAYGETSDKRYIAELNRFIKLEPDFIDVYAHLSFIFLEQDKPQKALNIALTGLAQSNRLIPDSFSGMIKCGYTLKTGRIFEPYRELYWHTCVYDAITMRLRLLIKC